MKKDLEGLIDKVWEANSVRKPLPNRPLAKRTLIRPNPFTAFLEKEVLMAHLAEKRFLDKLNFAKDPKGAQERLEQGKDRYSLKIVEYYHNALKEQQQMFQDERNAKIAAAKVKRERYICVVSVGGSCVISCYYLGPGVVKDGWSQDWSSREGLGGLGGM